MQITRNNTNKYPFEELEIHTQELALLQIKQQNNSISIHANHHPWFYGLNIDLLQQDLHKLGFTDNEIKRHVHFEHWVFVTPNGAANPYLEFDTTLPIADRITFPYDIDVLHHELNNGKKIFAKRPHTLPKTTKEPHRISASAQVHDVTATQPIQTVSTPRCPTCTSKDVRKITFNEKAKGFALLGVFSRKVQKQFHCNSCGYEW